MGTLRLFIAQFRLFIIYLLIFEKCNGLPHCSQDPCVNSTMILSENGSRTENCPNVQYSNCDAYISSGWYMADTPMLDFCPTKALGYSCGTTFPVWMNGTDPTVSDGVVDREVCLKGPTSCCQSTYAIQVKNCSNFMAYCLQHLAACPQRYCFGTNGPCLSTTTSTTTTTTTTSTTTTTTTTTIRPSTTDWDNGLIIPGIRAQANATDDEDVEQRLVNPYIGYTLTAIVCFILLAVLVVFVIKTFLCKEKLSGGATTWISYANSVNGSARGKWTRDNQNEKVEDV